MAFTDLYISNLKTTKSMKDFREKSGENFGVRVYPTGTMVFFYVYSFKGKQYNLAVVGNLTQRAQMSLLQNRSDPTKFTTTTTDHTVDLKPFRSNDKWPTE